MGCRVNIPTVSPPGVTPSGVSRCTGVVPSSAATGVSDLLTSHLGQMPYQPCHLP